MSNSRRNANCVTIIKPDKTRKNYCCTKNYNVKKCADKFPGVVEIVDNGPVWIPNCLKTIFHKFEGCLGIKRKRVFLIRTKVVCCEKCFKKSNSCLTKKCLTNKCLLTI